MSQKDFEASFITLVLSIASSAAMAMGLAPNPTTNKVEKDLKMAQFNIDLLILLEQKTHNNLTQEEQKYLKTVLNDLQMKFVQMKS